MAYVFLIIALICAAGWLIQYVVSGAILLWIVENEIPFPRDRMGSYIMRVWKKVLGIR